MTIVNRDEMRLLDTSIVDEVVESSTGFIFIWDSSDQSGRLVIRIVTAQASSSTDTLTKADHKLDTGDGVYASTASSGVSADTVYYVRRIDADSFKLYAQFDDAFNDTNPLNLTLSENVTLRLLLDPGQIYNVIKSNDSLSGNVGCWKADLTREKISICDFGCVADDVVGSSQSTDNTPPFRKFVNFAQLARKAGFVPSGFYRFNDQILINSRAGVSSSHTAAQPFDLQFENSQAVFRSHVSGDVYDTDVDGMLFVLDGIRDSIWSGGHIDFSEGDGAIAFRCRRGSAHRNHIKGTFFTGGDAASDRETNGRRSVKFIGNELESEEDTYFTYFNRLIGCKFNICFKHIENVVGGGDVGTRSPNANGSSDCHFENFIIAIDLDETDECEHNGVWMNSANGVVGKNGGKATCLRSGGFANRFSGILEPGTDSEPYNLLSTANKNMIDIVNNCSGAGTNQSSNQQLIIDRAKVLQSESVLSDALTGSGPVVLRAYSVAGLPTASEYSNAIVYVTNEVGGETIAFSDGTNWRRMQDRAIVSVN